MRPLHFLILAAIAVAIAAYFSRPPQLPEQPQEHVEYTEICDGVNLFERDAVILTDARVFSNGTGMLTIRNRTDRFMEKFEVCPRDSYCRVVEQTLSPRGSTSVVLRDLPEGRNSVGSHNFRVTPIDRACRYERL